MSTACNGVEIAKLAALGAILPWFTAMGLAVFYFRPKSDVSVNRINMCNTVDCRLDHCMGLDRIG